MTIDELRREALGLDVSSRARLAHELLSSLDDLSEAEIVFVNPIVDHPDGRRVDHL